MSRETAERFKNQHKKTLQATIDKRNGIIADIFAQDGIEKALKMLSDQGEEFKSQLAEAKTLKQKLADMTSSMEKARDPENLTGEKNKINQRILEFLKKSGAKKYIDEIRKIQQKLLTQDIDVSSFLA